jgi:hypothetical protein
LQILQLVHAACFGLAKPSMEEIPIIHGRDSGHS